jgi:hypothetical protein
MLMGPDLKCRECEGYDTTLTMQVDKGERGLVRFLVNCNRCGAYSHQLPFTEINRAVRSWILRNVPGGLGILDEGRAT